MSADKAEREAEDARFPVRKRMFTRRSKDTLLSHNTIPHSSLYARDAALRRVVRIGET